VNEAPGLNYGDFWCNVSSKDAYADIGKTLGFVYGYNVDIFSIIWSDVTVESMISLINELFIAKDKDKEKEGGSIGQVLPFVIMLKIVAKRNKIEGNLSEKIGKII